MCGILAVVRREIDERACLEALSTLIWRGPDVQWHRNLTGLFLAQTVLSITGTPKETPDLLFNGELYNYRKLADTQSDTEALEHLHRVMPAEHIPPFLDGMYAYVAKQGNALYLACDPQGEKSLYIYEDDEQIVVASEIRAIRRLTQLELDVDSLQGYFRTRHFVCPGRTAFRKVRQMLPGQMLRLDLETREWREVRRQTLADLIDPARIEANESRSLDDLADELDAILRQCAKEMVPERPWAAVVSGGVDSSLLAYYLTREARAVCLVAVDNVRDR